MTLFNAQALVVSLPLAELSNVELPGSIMTREQALNLPVSRTLACALALVESHCRKRGVATTYLARPEVFTHGLSARWLRKRLGSIHEHLCLSDASAIKVIDGCSTHIFLYRLAYHDSYASFFRLMRRAPELLNQVSSQLNTGFGWGTAVDRVQPPSVYLDAVNLPDPPPPALYPFRFSSNNFEHTAQDILHAKPSREADDIITASTLYIPLTETGLQDAAFARSAARHILRAFFNPQELLLLRLPSERHGETLATRIVKVLEVLAASRIILPRSAAPNIFLISSDLTTSAAFSNLSIALHESFEFWRHPRSFYDLAVSIRVEAAASNPVCLDFLPFDVTPIYGNCASRVWLNQAGLPWQPDWETA